MTTPLSGHPLTLFDSMARALVPFRPIDPTMVRLYSCGPTVYDFAHLGNLRAYVFTDTLRRTLNWKGWPTTHVINITDVGHLTSDADTGEDKMEAAAGRQARTIWEVAAFYTDAFRADLASLNVLDPSLWSIATDHIQDMIGFALALEAAGVTYRLPGGLYFDTAKLPDYGRLAGGGGTGVGRIGDVVGKRNSADFAIWRTSSEPGSRQMEWASPWGPGAPGWHLECSVMSLKYLGRQFDIHTGGIDHREIHHCNEIAQNQAFTGGDGTGANIWMHNNFLVDRVGKLSKSRGGVATLPALVGRGFHPRAYRLFCLSGHYRSELEFSLDAVAAAAVRLKRLVASVGALREQVGDADWQRPLREIGAARGAAFTYQRGVAEAGLPPRARGYLNRFDAAVSADLMTPQALPVLDEAIADKRLSADERLRLIAVMDLVLGLDILALDRRSLSCRPDDAKIDETDVERLLAERRAARAAKDFATSDALRDRLIASGVEVMDGDALAWEWRPLLA